MIKFKVLKLKEYRDYMNKVNKLDKKSIESGDYDTVMKLAGLTATYILEWDLKDVDSGELLPIPSEDANVIEELTAGQMNELLTTFMKAQTEIPNSNGGNS